MPAKTTSFSIENVKDLTFNQLLRLLSGIKLRILFSVLMTFVSILTLAYTTGKYSQARETAIILESPFSMRIKLNDKNYDFENLILIKDPSLLPGRSDTVLLSIREFKSEFDIIQIGKIVARIEKRDTGFWSFILSAISIGAVKASEEKEKFNWKGHSKDFKFKEEFVDKHIIHRYYSDSCILEYQVDDERRSVPESFIWLRSVHE